MRKPLLYLELELIAEAEHVDVGLEVIIVAVDMLVSVENAEGVLLGDFPVKTYVIAHLLNIPGVEEFYIGVWGDGEALLVVFHLQTATEHVLAHAAIDLLLAIIDAVQAIPALIDGLLRAIGVLPAFAQGEAKVAKELLVEGERHVETVARAPVVGIFLSSAYLSIAVEHLVISRIEITGALIMIIEVGIAGRGLEPLGDLIVDTEAEAPAIDGLGVVAGAELGFEAGTPVLGEFLLGLEREVESEVIALG